MLLETLDDMMGYVLLRALHRVETWSLAPGGAPGAGQGHARDASAWREAAEKAPLLAPAAGIFAALDIDGSLLRPAQLAAACATVATWAEEQSLFEVSVQFSEAAARIEPRSPKYANRAGFACRSMALWSRADQWYLRGVGLARATGDVREKSTAHLGAGTVALRQGRYEIARRHFVTAGWAAHRCGNRRIAARAQHDLLTLAIGDRAYSTAIMHAEKALRWYPRRHARLPYLAHHLAFLLLRINRAKPGLALAQSVIELLSKEHERLVVHGTIAGLAAACGDETTFLAAKQAILASALHFPEYAPPAFCNLAEGAWIRGESADARAYAAEALSGGMVYKLDAVVRFASELLTALGHGRAPSVDPCDHVEERRIDALAAEMLARLKRLIRSKSSQSSCCSSQGDD